jgi:hypothetical protein
MWQNGKGRQDVIQIPRLEPKDLYDRRIRRDYARLRAYNTLLEQIYHRVYATSQLSGNTSSVLYTVPPFILGLPKLDMEDCIVYLVWQLRQSKFDVRFTWPNMLFISWKHHEGDYLSKQNPIVQAMIPDPPPLPKATAGGSKKKAQPQGPAPPQRPTVAFNEDVELLTNSSYSGSAFGNPTPRRAADYEPPASFLQNMDRPGPGRVPKEGSTTVKGNVLADLWAIN